MEKGLGIFPAKLYFSFYDIFETNMESEAKRLLLASMAGFFASISLWLLVPLAVFFEQTFLLAFFPLFLVIGASFISWFFLERAGIRGPALWIVPVLISMLVLLPSMSSSVASSLGAVEQIVDWFVWGPSFIVYLMVACFAALFLLSAIKVGFLGTIIAALVGLALGIGITVGAFGMGPEVSSASTATQAVSVHLCPVLGALVGAILTLLVLILKGE